MSDNGYLSKADFLAALTGQEVDRDIPGLGKVRLRPVTMEETAGMRQRNTRNGIVDTAGMATEAIIASLVNPKLDASDLAALRMGKAGVVDRLMGIVSEISGITISEETENLAGVGS